MKFCSLSLFLGLVVTCALVTVAHAQTLSLDDNPAAPIFSVPGAIPGNGAEDEFGFAGIGASLGPSPSLGAVGLPDGGLFSPGVPAASTMTPNGSYIDAFSTNHFPPSPLLPPVTLQFSVDRTAVGIGALGAEAAAVQQSGDIYTSSATFPAPGVFAGGLLPGPFAGVLPTAGGGGTNGLIIDESTFGLVTGAGVVPPGVPGGPLGPGTHDNVDAFDFMPLSPGGVFPVHSYFAISPDEAISTGTSAADIFDIAAGSPGTVPTPYAPAITMGLDALGGLNSDSIDALIVFDDGLGFGGPATSGPGVEPVLDYALFSLAPGSITLTVLGLDAGDVFFTDFTGAFAVYAFSTDLGIAGAPGGPVFGPSNIDALELTQIPEPSTFLISLVGVGLWAASRRKK